MDSKVPHKSFLPVFTPFSDEAWKATVSSGLIHVSGVDLQEAVEAYSLVRDLNNLIDCQKRGLRIIITPSIEEHEDIKKHAEFGISILTLIRRKAQNLARILEELEKQLRANRE